MSADGSVAENIPCTGFSVRTSLGGSNHNGDYTHYTSHALLVPSWPLPPPKKKANLNDDLSIQNPFLEQLIVQEGLLLKSIRSNRLENMICPSYRSCFVCVVFIATI